MTRRKGTAGAERTECKGEEGESRQARIDVFRMERKGRDWKRMAGVEWRVRSGSFGIGTAGKERTGAQRGLRQGLISLIHLLFFLWLKKITSTKKQHLLDEELKLKMLAKN